MCSRADDPSAISDAERRERDALASIRQSISIIREASRTIPPPILHTAIGFYRLTHLKEWRSIQHDLQTYGPIPLPEGDLTILRSLGFTVA